MSLKDILSPFYVWKRAFEKPYTTPNPLTDRPGADRYRGFHQNDIEKCIGCGSCEEICQNAAIDLVPVEGVETRPGNSGLRPRIDYGRCCWCALCVDICPTGSLTMSNEYQWNNSDPEVFRFTLGAEEKSWDRVDKGYRRAEAYRLVESQRVEMGVIDPPDRIGSFIEMIRGYSKTQALAEADRCVECGICIATCPAHMGIPGYIKAVREDDIEAGLRILYETNPLPAICGRVCTHKCEEVCAMGHSGDSISIRWLKRYIADQVPFDKYRDILEAVKPVSGGRKIAVVGAGAAGLSAAYYLAMQGYAVKIFEVFPESGGMMRYGIPEYRLPYDQIDKDVNFIKSLGVEIVLNTRIGRDVSIEELHQNYDAVFVATGLHQGRSTRVPGADHEDVYQAIDLLRDFTLGKEIPVKAKIVVIGGGNVAMDISRTLARLQLQKFGKIQIITTSLETEDIIPADREEIDEALEESITLMPGWGPETVQIENNQIKGLKVIRCVAVFDEQGRFNPRFNPAEQMFFAGEMIVEAIGQGMDLSYFPETLKQQLEFNERRQPKVNGDFQSSLPWLFVGGDIVEGPDAIHAIANGHVAAKGIDKYLSQKRS
jgi:glutamate synthase (NADPH/NADH) small chain